MKATAPDPLDRFEALVRAMSDPAFYPHPVSSLERRETHISSVFLTGKWVYKLKKPFDLGFLDFRELEDRRRFCGLEVDLNRRLSRGVYQDVVEIYEDKDHGFSLKPGGRVVEYAVKMRQLPEAANLTELLKKNKVRPVHLKKLGQRLAAFHQESSQSPEIDRFGRLEVISANAEENFSQLEPFVGEVIEEERWEFIREVNRSFLEHRQDLFRHRLEAGRIRDGHGDLRAEHVYFYKGLQIIDCIEFLDRFRYGDAALDLAFLHMDLEHLGYPDVSRALLAEYAACSNDTRLYTLLDYYTAYRSIVRLKVSCFRAQEMEEDEKQPIIEEARRFMNLAYRYTVQFSRPTLWVCCGLSASGKSYLAKGLAEALSIPAFQSDAVRKQEHPEAQPEVVPYGQGLYRPGMRQIMYSRLLARAQDALKAGRSVVMDATFSRRKWRNAARQLAADHNTNIIFAQCVCPKETIRARLKNRETSSGLSDARLEHLESQIEEFEPLTELPTEIHLKIDTNRPKGPALHEALSLGYASQCAQVKKVL